MTVSLCICLQSSQHLWEHALIFRGVFMFVCMCVCVCVCVCVRACMSACVWVCLSLWCVLFLFVLHLFNLIILLYDLSVCFCVVILAIVQHTLSKNRRLFQLDKVELEFKDHRVHQLWALAQKTSWSAKELESFKVICQNLCVFASAWKEFLNCSGSDKFPQTK